MTPKLLNLAADLLEKAALATAPGTTDWQFPEDWTEAEKHEFALGEAIFAVTRNEDDTSDGVYPDESPPPDFAVMGYLAELLRVEAAKGNSRVPEGRFG